MNIFSSIVTTDRQLCEKSLAGDRNAFGLIVTRYQALICSLAYSASGDLARSQDLAQDSFLLAWQRLAELRDPDKLRPWLCGIVRNLAAAQFRKETRRGAMEPLDAVSEQGTQETTPADQAVTQEEAGLLWRTLAEVPALYREPLILFYREQQSIADVAKNLEVTEETARQRLSRGRALLREEMTALVERTLPRTRTGTAFVVGVLAGLPLLTPPAAKAAIVATAGGAKGAAAVAKGPLASFGVGLWWGPVIGLFTSWVSLRALARTARSEQEYTWIKRHVYTMVALCFGLCAALVVALSRAGEWYPVTGEWLMAGVLAWVGLLIWSLLYINAHMQRGLENMRKSDARRC